VSAMPSSLIEPIWVEFAALLPARPEFAPTHPLGCHRRRVPDRVVFEHVLAALVHGSGYERIATAACSDRTIRRRRTDWARWGLATEVPAICLAAFDTRIGLRRRTSARMARSPTRPAAGRRPGPLRWTAGKAG